MNMVRKNKWLLPVIGVSVVVVLIVGYFVFNYTVEKITEREVRRITQQEIGRITGEETERITDEIIGANKGKLKEVECNKTPTQRKFNSSPYYTGPLIDAHLHMPLTFEVPPAIYAEAEWDAPILEKQVAAGDIICGFDLAGIRYAFGFYVVPSLLKGQAVRQIRQVEQQYPGRIIPFLMPAHVTGLDIQSEDAEEILSSNKGLFKGFGEVAFYKGSFRSLNPDSPSMLEIYKVADKHNLVVMIHPDDGQKEAIERILKEYPDVKFLLHGENMESWAPDVVGVYPNAYYSIDATLSDFPPDRKIANIYGPEKEEFVSEFTDYFDRILEYNAGVFKPMIEKYPDNYLWGTDRAYDWHFDLDATALLEEMSRSFIGQLSPDVQEKFAYANAEKLLEGDGR